MAYARNSPRPNRQADLESATGRPIAAVLAGGTSVFVKNNPLADANSDGEVAAASHGLVPFKTSPLAAQPCGFADASCVPYFLSNGVTKGSFTMDVEKRRLQSMHSQVKTAARLAEQQIGRKGVENGLEFHPVLLTLTYGQKVAWAPHHISSFIERMRKYFARRGFHKLLYVWVAELQRRGMIHYHVCVWWPTELNAPPANLRNRPKRLQGRGLPKVDDLGWWPHGMANRVWAIAPSAYMSKYMSKSDSKQSLPKGARMYGSGGLRGQQLAELRWWKLPKWHRDQIPWSEAQKAPYANWRRGTVQSPYRCIGIGYGGPVMALRSEIDADPDMQRRALEYEQWQRDRRDHGRAGPVVDFSCDGDVEYLFVRNRDRRSATLPLQPAAL